MYVRGFLHGSENGRVVTIVLGGAPLCFILLKLFLEYSVEQTLCWYFLDIWGGHRGHDRMVVDLQLPMQLVPITTRSRHGRDRMVVGFTTTNAISAYHH